MSVRRRIALPDEIRGFCIVCMVFYHAFYLFGTRLNLPFFLWLFHFFEPVQLLFASAFILISGLCTRLSRSVLRRGLMLLGVAVLISAATVFLLPRIGFDGFQDRFGILHLLSASMLLTAALKKPLERIPPKIGSAVCIVLYAASRLLTEKIRVETPLLFPLGFISDSFYSADYFPLLPHVFCFFLGSFIGKSVLRDELPESAYRVHARPFAFFGRHSLAVYLLHVPVLLICIFLIERI